MSIDQAIQPGPPSAGDRSAAPPELSLRGMTKRFPGVVANDSIDLDIPIIVDADQVFKYPSFMYGPWGFP